MARKLGNALQFIAVLAGLMVTPLWGVVAVVIFPWIVPADSVGAGGVYGDASKVALGLAIASAVSVFLASGVFASRRSRWGVATVLLAGHVVAAFYLYRSLDLTDERAVILLACQGVSVAVICIGAACGLPEPAA